MNAQVGVRCAIDELNFNCVRSGPRALSENVVGPAIKNAALRRALPSRLPPVQPLNFEHSHKMALWQS